MDLLVGLLCFGAITVIFLSYFTYFQCFRADPKRRDEPFAVIRGRQYRENRENMLFELDTYISQLLSYRTALEEKDTETLIALLDEVKRRKEEVDGCALSK